MGPSPVHEHSSKAPTFVRKSYVRCWFSLPSVDILSCFVYSRSVGRGVDEGRCDEDTTLFRIRHKYKCERVRSDSTAITHVHIARIYALSPPTYSSQVPQVCSVCKFPLP